MADRILLHQIHPLKLATDWITGIAGLYLLWLHQLWPALIVIVVPAVLASVLLIRFADLDKYETSAFGRYVARYMTPRMQAARLGGFAAAAFGAWHHSLLAVALGFVVVLVAWFRGRIFG
jgi:cobalamin synthase